MKDCLSYTPAWDTLVWFSLMVAMSSQLNATGVTQYFTNHITAFVGMFVTSWTATFYFLHLFYMLMRTSTPTSPLNMPHSRPM
jgi:DASS family divalent anion:Na+ symporter